MWVTFYGGPLDLEGREMPRAGAPRALDIPEPPVTDVVTAQPSPVPAPMVLHRYLLHAGAGVTAPFYGYDGRRQV